MIRVRAEYRMKDFFSPPRLFGSRWYTMTAWSAQKGNPRVGKVASVWPPKQALKDRQRRITAARPVSRALLKYCRVNNYPQLPGEGGGHDYPESRYSV